MAGNDFTLEVKGITGLKRALREYPRLAMPILQRAFTASQAILAKNTLKDDPVPWRTGNLLQSFRFRVGRLESRWFPTAKYAPFVEFGRGPIYPKNGKVLSWATSSGGGYATSASGRRNYKGGTAGRVFARYVGPAAPRPFMGKILEKSKDDVLKLFKQAADLINKQIVNEVKFD